MFGQEKPVIALLHIRALPGDPLYEGDLEDVAAQAGQDLRALQDGGGDGVLFSNEFSMPYQQKTDIAAVSAMAYIIGRLKKEIKLPFGVDVITDGASAIDLAAATGAQFVRGIFTGAYVGDCGIFNTYVSEVLRRKKALGLDKLRMLYFLNCESDAYMAHREWEHVAKSVIFNCAPDVLCISGPGAGEPVSSEWIRKIKASAGKVPVFANTGCNASNVVEKLEAADGCCVGTTFKKDGVFANPVDKNRVLEFMEQVHKYREKENQ